MTLNNEYDTYPLRSAFHLESAPGLLRTTRRGVLPDRPHRRRSNSKRSPHRRGHLFSPRLCARVAKAPHLYRRNPRLHDAVEISSSTGESDRKEIPAFSLPQQDPQDIGLLCPPRTNHRSLTEMKGSGPSGRSGGPRISPSVLFDPFSPRSAATLPLRDADFSPRFESPRREIFFSEYRRGTDESKSCARAGERKENITATVPGIAIRASLPQESPSPSSSRKSPRGRGDERRHRPGEDQIPSENIREEVGLGQRGERV
ncbi:uncharacterized protein K489DRAFT_31630 [Dissoconium aciculare CBS 342.82]|uniref:Uncharacterized protein n=1 Tax=Dissoconium aciculare CBS 342.82 TaxID=1314786 RepID=A0A6J3MJ27_9PEZI|nr:uncharacterized protein K489DRAFT_31630 [Dissoconium aciculare CBS 342.82]KAF1827916.1 hypothetical protein K489DRAFT_31630 [Dissoconium aciculare CBS 342.82]